MKCPTGSPPNCYRDSFTAFLPAVQFFRNALVGDDQLRQRVAFALSQILVVSDGEVNSTYGMADYQQAAPRPTPSPTTGRFSRT